MILVAAPANDSISSLVVTAKAGLGIIIFYIHFILGYQNAVVVSALTGVSYGSWGVHP